MPHTRHSCKFEERSPKQYVQEYHEFLADDRKDAGKFYASVIDAMLFPIRTLDHVVPPVLHIMMGIVEKLYTILEEECEALDAQDDESSSGDESDEDEIDVTLEVRISSMFLDFDLYVKCNIASVVLIVNDPLAIF